MLISHFASQLSICFSTKANKCGMLQVILYCRQLDHPKALRVLAVTLNDINSAIRYCKKHARHEGFISLLEMLLRPGEGREPMYTEACQVSNAQETQIASSCNLFTIRYSCIKFYIYLAFSFTTSMLMLIQLQYFF